MGKKIYLWMMWGIVITKDQVLGSIHAAPAVFQFVTLFCIHHLQKLKGTSVFKKDPPAYHALLIVADFFAKLLSADDGKFRRICSACRKYSSIIHPAPEVAFHFLPAFRTDQPMTAYLHTVVSFPFLVLFIKYGA
jgi:hypothetical protein